MKWVRVLKLPRANAGVNQAELWCGRRPSRGVRFRAHEGHGSVRTSRQLCRGGARHRAIQETTKGSKKLLSCKRIQVRGGRLGRGRSWAWHSKLDPWQFKKWI